MSDRSTEGKALEPWKFQPGNTIGHGGRPKLREDLKRTLRGELTDEAIRTFREILGDKTARNADRLRAAEDVMERAWGKVVQGIDLADARQRHGFDLSAVPKDKLDAFVDVLAMSLPSGAAPGDDAVPVDPCDGEGPDDASCS